MKKLFVIAMLFVGGIFYLFMGKPTKTQAIKRYFPITENFQSDNTIRARNDTLYHRIGRFNYTDQFGQKFSQDDLEGNIYVAAFFFTRCGGICPKLTRSLKKVQETLKKEKGIMYLSHSVDPSFDTPEVLRVYGESYGADFKNWKFLTGYEPEKFYDFVQKNYYVTVMEGDEGSAEIFDHTQKLVLVDRDRIIRGYYDGTDSLAVNRLLSDMLLLQMEYHERKEVKYEVRKKENQ